MPPIAARTHLTGMCIILVSPVPKSSPHSKHVQMSEKRRQFVCLAQRCNSIELRLDGRGAELVHSCRIHAARVFIADFLLVWRAIWIRLRCVFQNLLQVQTIQFEKFCETAVRGLVGRKRIPLEPVVATKTVKVL